MAAEVYTEYLVVAMVVVVVNNSDDGDVIRGACCFCEWMDI